jgi:hypothetical protein
MTMDAALLLFTLLLFLAVFNAGSHTCMQIQHYGVYPLVGRDGFAAYMTAQNRAALVPAILPGVANLIVAAILLGHRPAFMSAAEAGVALALNVVAFVSTFAWQARIQAGMAKTGYDEAKTRTLLATNWIRLGALVAQGALATVITAHALQR